MASTSLSALRAELASVWMAYKLDPSPEAAQAINRLSGKAARLAGSTARLERTLAAAQRPAAQLAGVVA